MNEPSGDQIVVKTWPLPQRTLIFPTSAGRPLTLEKTSLAMTTAAMIGSAISSGAW